MQVIFDKQDYKEIERRFMQRCSHPPGDACWEWLWGRYADGYGAMTYKRLYLKSHWWSFILSHRRWPKKGFYVLHRCDNRRCVNPDHIYEGTPQQNMQDLQERGNVFYEGLPGDRNPASKLTWPQVREIRHKYKEGTLQVVLAAEYNVSQSAISGIVRGVSWRE